LACLLVFLAVFTWSGISPKDRFTWLLEVFPAVIGAVVLLGTYRRFRFTTLVYVLICIHACILCVGGRYTYAEVPLFNWIRDAFGLARNHYDRVGHFAQGFVPAMVARELLLRTSPLRPGKWLSFLIICVCMAISAWYELLEWGVADATGTAADAFLGTQGDPWDTQNDMLMALIGAVTALATLSRVHNRLLVRDGAYDRYQKPAAEPLHEADSASTSSIT
jgi:putative membrane protein